MRIALLLLASSASASGLAQTRSAQDTATAYGARLTGDAQPANMNQHRVNNRINTRIENRISLRIERYRVGNTADPTEAYRAAYGDQGRTAPAPTETATRPSPGSADQQPVEPDGTP